MTNFQRFVRSVAIAIDKDLSKHDEREGEVSLEDLFSVFEELSCFGHNVEYLRHGKSLKFTYTCTLSGLQIIPKSLPCPTHQDAPPQQFDSITTPKKLPQDLLFSPNW